MSDTGLDIFDKTLQSTHIWLDDLKEVHRQDKQSAWHLLTATLRTLRDQLPPDLVAHFGAQLPMLLRGAYYEQYDPANHPNPRRDRASFVNRVEETPTATGTVTEEAVSSVLRVVNQRVDSGMVEKVRNALPDDIRALWPA